MGMKFLNKKGWHTGSLRNIENVWKAEQKNELEKKKLEELRKQIQEEKERSEFRRLQEQAGLVPRQERLEFLYDSGLSVGKPSSDSSFKSLEALPQPTATTTNEVGASSSAAKQDAVPGALFEEKQQSANDTWRKLHSDPLLMIRQREQEALARIKNNPVKMAMIRKSVEAKKQEDDDSENKKVKRKHRKKHSSSKNRSDSEDEDRKRKKHASSKHRNDSEDDDDRRHKKHTSSKYLSDSEDEDVKRKNDPSSKNRIEPEDDGRRRRKHSPSKYPSDSEDQNRRYRKHASSKHQYESDDDGRKHQKLASSKHRTVESGGDDRRHRKYDSSKHQSDSEDEDRRPKKHGSSKHQSDSEDEKIRQNKHASSKYRDEETDVRGREKESNKEGSYRSSKHNEYSTSNKETTDGKARHQKQPREEYQKQRTISHDTDKPLSGYRRRNVAPKLTEEERAAKLREMQMDAELHEDQRWRRLKKADENDAKEAIKSATAKGKSFLDAAQESVYGAELGGSATIEDSVRRRSHFRQSRSAAEGNAFRR